MRLYLTLASASDKIEAQLPLETLWVLPTQTDLSPNHTYTFISPERRLLVYAENNVIMDTFATKCETAVKNWYGLWYDGDG